jgi:hypothetical protein
MDAVKEFAGDNPSIAVCSPEDDSDRARARRVVEYIRHRFPPVGDREGDAAAGTAKRDEALVLRAR